MRHYLDDLDLIKFVHKQQSTYPDNQTLTFQLKLLMVAVDL